MQNVNLPTSNDVVECNDLRIGYPPTRMVHGSQRREPLDHGFGQLVACDFLHNIHELNHSALFGNDSLPI